MDSGKVPLHHSIRKERVAPPYVPPIPMELIVGHSVYFIMGGSVMTAVAMSASSHPAAPPLTTGERLPAVITAVNADGSLNLHVMTNGHGSTWANNCVEGTAPGDWARTL